MGEEEVWGFGRGEQTAKTIMKPDSMSGSNSNGGRFIRLNSFPGRTDSIRFRDCLPPRRRPQLYRPGYVMTIHGLSSKEVLNYYENVV
jgi:hypothetical protein